MKAKSYHDWYIHHQEKLGAGLAAQGEGPGAGLSVEVVRYSHLKNYILSMKRSRTFWSPVMTTVSCPCTL